MSDCRLRFDYDEPASNTCYISCDNFFLEVEVAAGGIVGDVKLGQGGEPQSEPVLQHLLQTGRYALFCRHLRGLSALLHDLPVQKEDRGRVYAGLCAVEQDLAALNNCVRYE